MMEENHVAIHHLVTRPLKSKQLATTAWQVVTFCALRRLNDCADQRRRAHWKRTVSFREAQPIAA